MRYLAIITACEMSTFALLMANNPAIDAFAARFSAGLTGFAMIGHVAAIAACGALTVIESVRTIRNL